MSQGRTQHVWVDAAKGGAILLVVIGHAWRGLEAAGLLSAAPEGLFTAIDSRIYAFHMPLFFLLGGLFVVPSMCRRSVSAFVTGRVMRLLYPLVLWTYAFALAKVLAGEWANTPLTLGEMRLSPIPGQWHFWFLWALFLLNIGLLALRPALCSERWRRPAILTLLPAALLLATLPLPQTLHDWTNNALKFLPYFALGIGLGHFGTGALRAERFGLAYLAGGVLLLAAVPWLEAIGGLYLPTAIGLCLASVALAIAGTRHWPKAAGALAVLGRYSMIIFLSHTLFSAATRVALIHLGVGDVLLHMTAATATGW